MDSNEKTGLLESIATQLAISFNSCMFLPNDGLEHDDPIVMAGVDRYRKFIRDNPDPAFLLLLIEAFGLVLRLRMAGHPAYTDPFKAAQYITEAIKMKVSDGGKIIAFPSSTQ